MTRSQKIALTAGVTLSLLVVGAVVALAAAVYGAGMVEIEVQERDGTLVGIRLPGALVECASGLAFHFAPEEAFADCGDEMSEVMPLVRGLCGALARCPDTEFVEVEGAHEHVRVAKEGGKLVVRVEDHGDHVFVSIPIAVVDTVLGHLEKASRRV
jgi:hypothetical protein